MIRLLIFIQLGVIISLLQKIIVLLTPVFGKYPCMSVCHSGGR